MTVVDNPYVAFLLSGNILLSGKSVTIYFKSYKAHTIRYEGQAGVWLW